MFYTEKNFSRPKSNFLALFKASFSLITGGSYCLASMVKALGPDKETFLSLKLRLFSNPSI